MYDYGGSMTLFQNALDLAGIDYDISNISGCTYREIVSTVATLIKAGGGKNPPINRCDECNAFRFYSRGSTTELNCDTHGIQRWDEPYDFKACESFKRKHENTTVSVPLLLC